MFGTKERRGKKEEEILFKIHFKDIENKQRNNTVGK